MSRSACLQYSCNLSAHGRSSPCNCLAAYMLLLLLQHTQLKTLLWAARLSHESLIRQTMQVQTRAPLHTNGCHCFTHP